MAISSLLVAVVAVVVAALSAVFTRSQVAEMRRQFKMAGPIIEVTASTVIPVGMHTDQIQTGVTATNKGRGDVTVQNWGFTLGGPGRRAGVAFGTMYPNAIGVGVPYVLAGMTSQTWFMDKDGLSERARMDGFTNVRPFVDLGDGSRIEGDPLRET